MTEWIAIVAALVAIFATSARGAAWLRRKVATARERRSREREIERSGELEHWALTYAAEGLSPRDTARIVKVRKSAVRRALREANPLPHV